jgi:hypothetical protein
MQTGVVAVEFRVVRLVLIESKGLERDLGDELATDYRVNHREVTP